MHILQRNLWAIENSLVPYLPDVPYIPLLALAVRTLSGFSFMYFWSEYPSV